MAKARMNKADVKEFYDAYVPRQRSVGINIRHLTIINRLKKAGLKRNSSLLEIGCGIGTLTKLLAQIVTKGKLVATDISEASVQHAQKALKKYDNIEFTTADINEFHDHRKFDFIILADVLEHVPVEQHPAIFRKLSSMMDPHSVLAINIPFPPYNAWNSEHNPAEMQIIDQALHSNELLNAAYPAGLYLKHLETYSLWNRPYDYQWIVFNKNEYATHFDRKSKFEVIRKTLQIKYGE